MTENNVTENNVTHRHTACLRFAAVVAVILGLAACGSDAPIEYSAENREAFMAACVDPAVDGIFQQRVCLCVYEEAAATIPFERFLEIEEQLGDAEEPALPEDLLGLVARCVIDEGDL